jgi:cobalt-zinc-cadmium efflux system protein
VLAAQASGILLLGAAGWLIWTAIGRLDQPVHVEGGGLVVVALLGLIVNLFSARLLARSKGDSLNMRGAHLHMVLDAAGSVGALAAGLLVVTAGLDRADAAVSILISLMLLWSAWHLLRDTTHVLLEGTPAGLVPDEISEAMASVPGVDAVHHLHLWNLASDIPILSAHVVLGGELTLHEAQERGDRVKEMLETRFGIGHATLELECHSCEELPSPPPEAGTESGRVL